MRGLGISYRPEWKDQVEMASAVDFLERVFDGEGSDTIWQKRGDSWKDRPWVTHSTAYSVASGSDVPRHGDWGSTFSEHLSYSSSGKISVGNFFPAGFDDASLNVISNWIRTAQAALPSGTLLALENVCTFFSPPTGSPSVLKSIIDPETELLVHLSQIYGVGILLDVNNLWINARNRGFDPFAALKVFGDVPIAYLHVAGHCEGGGLWLDSHSTRVSVEVWELAQVALRSTSAKAIVLERDLTLEMTDEILKDLSIARDLLSRAE